jgi:23S rRNA (adenine2030-N6)-methyltransferase
MLSYRHAFHAGNFADVFKHVVLTMLLQALARKDKPYVYIDTHAGAGRYDLHSEAARKHREFASGIARVWGETGTPVPVAAYLEAVAALNAASGRAADAGGTPRWYPGSPRIARHLLRQGDRMVLGELHSSEVPLLQREFARDRCVQVVRGDGYHLMKSHLPPPERRGLVLIDPSYERREEIEHLVTALREGHQRWATGIYAIWYPVMPKVPVAVLHRRIIAIGTPKVLCAELCVLPDDNPLGMNGAGMIIVNPPFQFDIELRQILPWLRQRLDVDAQGRAEIRWLVPE